MNLMPVSWLLFHCKCGDRVSIPHQSPSGKCDDQAYVATGYWPVTFLCRKLVQVYEGYAEEIDLQLVEKPCPGLGRTVLWQIEVRCDQPECEMTTPIYARHHAGDSPNTVIDLLLRANPVLDRKNHEHCPSLLKEYIDARILKY